jgi:hypothetical protein
MTLKSELLRDHIEVTSTLRGDVSRGLGEFLTPTGTPHLIQSSHPAVEVFLVDEHHASATASRDPVHRPLGRYLLCDACGIANKVCDRDDFFHTLSILYADAHPTDLSIGSFRHV